MTNSTMRSDGSIVLSERANREAHEAAYARPRPAPTYRVVGIRLDGHAETVRAGVSRAEAMQFANRCRWERRRGFLTFYFEREETRP